MAFIIFGLLSGPIPLSDLDANFALCATTVDLAALAADVAGLPGVDTPLKPKAGGSVGVAATLSHEDHQHPPQSALPNFQTGTTYTLQASDDGVPVDLTNAAAITLTLPNNAAAGFSTLITQGGAGQVTFTPQAGASMRQRQSLTKTAGQWALVTAYVRTNAGGTSAEWVVGGDMA